MKRELAMCSVFAFLYGCGNQPTQPVEPLPIVQPKQQVNIPPSLLEDCPPIKRLPVQKYSQKETLGPVKTWTNQYTDCANNHHALASLAAQAVNIAVPAASAPVAASAPMVPK